MTDRALFPVGAQMAAADYIFSQIPLRFPNLRFILSEGGAGWVPALHDRLWDVQKELDNPNYDGEWPLDIDEKPTDILLRNFRFSSLYDPTAFALVDRIGAENLLIESDYPHQDTMWPDTQAVTDEQLRHLPADVVAKITHGNAADLFRMPIPAESVWKAMP